jgi:hypothetical protein
MRPGVPSDPEAITAVLDRYDAVQAEVASLSFDALSAPQALTVKDRLEMVSRRQAAVDHRLTHQLTSQAKPGRAGRYVVDRRTVQPATHRPRRGPPPPR